MSLNRFFSKRNPFESTGRGSPGFRMKGGRGSGSAGMGDGHLGTGGWQGGVGRVAGPMVVGMSSSVHHHHWVGQSRLGGDVQECGAWEAQREGHGAAVQAPGYGRDSWF